mgnify:CR=1 FL=1
MTTDSPARCARAAAASLRTPVCIQIVPIPCDPCSVIASSALSPAAALARKMSTRSIGGGTSASRAKTTSFSSRVPASFGALACLTLHPNPESSRWPVAFVERGPSWGANAWIGAAERELTRGAASVVLLEAGGEYPNGARTLEIAAIARVKLRSHLPIVVDAPTIAQRARYIPAVACAAVAAGADGVILRVWVGPEGAVHSAPATLSWTEAVELAERLRAIGAVVRR